MNNKKSKAIAILIITLFGLINSGIACAEARTFTVDDSGGADYTSIQAAVDNANAGDTIEVWSGTYYENVDVTKQLILRGVDTGAGKPVVNANGNGNAIHWSSVKILN